MSLRVFHRPPHDHTHQSLSLNVFHRLNGRELETKDALMRKATKGIENMRRRR